MPPSSTPHITTYRTRFQSLLSCRLRPPRHALYTKGPVLYACNFSVSEEPCPLRIIAQRETLHTTKCILKFYLLVQIFLQFDFDRNRKYSNQGFDFYVDLVFANRVSDKQLHIIGVCVILKPKINILFIKIYFFYHSDLQGWLLSTTQGMQHSVCNLRASCAAQVAYAKKCQPHRRD
jgi:hypothetical protein